jgi:hypothetical protein
LGLLEIVFHHEEHEEHEEISTGGRATSSHHPGGGFLPSSRRLGEQFLSLINPLFFVIFVVFVVQLTFLGLCGFRHPARRRLPTVQPPTQYITRKPRLETTRL